MIAGRNINNLIYVDNTTLMAETEEELRSLLMRVKDVSEKAGLKLIIQKTMIIGSDPIMANKWGKSGNSDRFGVPKLPWIVTAAMKLKDACSLEEKI